MEILGLIDIPFWALSLGVLCILSYIYFTRNFGIFVQMGVPGPKPWPVFGNVLACVMKGFVESHAEWYQRYGKTFGIFEGSHPMLYMCDLDALRDLTVRDFNKFPNRRNFGLENISEPPISELLTVLKDDDWRHNRNTLTPAFSSGKLKKMTDSMNSKGDRLTQALKPLADSEEPLNIKSFTSAYTMDIIAAAAFGIDLDTKSTPDDPFIKQAKKFFEVSLLKPVFMIIFFFPALLPLLKLMKVPIFPKEAVDFFSNITGQALTERRNNPEKHSDFIQLMVQAEKEAQSSSGEHNDNINNSSLGSDNQRWVDKRKGQGLRDSEIIAAAILFFTAGYETTATALVHGLFHLAHNPDAMDRLIEEIDGVLPDGKSPDYESLGKLPYLEMVVMETLRINPPIGRMDRICERDTEFRGLKVPAGVSLALPIYLIHHDPEYWPNPEVFDPERFTAENKEQHHPLQWIPFGNGPRHCIGMRLALAEMKICLIKLFQKYRFTTNSKTKPLKFGDMPILSMKEGVWLTAQHRN